jgi:hypothetical protein
MVEHFVIIFPKANKYPAAIKLTTNAGGLIKEPVDDEHNKQAGPCKYNMQFGYVWFMG